MILNYGSYLQEHNHWEDSFKAYEKGVNLFTWPQVRPPSLRGAAGSRQGGWARAGALVSAGLTRGSPCAPSPSPGQTATGTSPSSVAGMAASDACAATQGRGGIASAMGGGAPIHGPWPFPPSTVVPIGSSWGRGGGCRLWKGKGRGEGRLGQGGRGRSQGGERPMGTTAYGGKGSKGRAANGDRPVGATSCRQEQHTMASCQNSPPPPCPPTYNPLTCAQPTGTASQNLQTLSSKGTCVY